MLSRGCFPTCRAQSHEGPVRRAQHWRRRFQLRVASTVLAAVLALRGCTSARLRACVLWRLAQPEYHSNGQANTPQRNTPETSQSMPHLVSFGYQICEGVLDLAWQFSHPLLGVMFVQIWGGRVQVLRRRFWYQKMSESSTHLSVSSIYN